MASYIYCRLQQDGGECKEEKLNGEGAGRCLEIKVLCCLK